MDHNNAGNDLIKAFKGFYQHFDQADFTHIDRLYSPDVVFKDPVHEVRGLVHVQDYMVSISTGLQECRFEYHDELISTASAYIKWVMHYRHPRLGRHTIDVKGITHLRFNERVYFHEDIYDLGAMLYEHIPLLGFVTRKLKHHISR